MRAVLRRNSDGSEGYNGETHTALSSFRRANAFFAVIFVTDEEDQSRKQNGSNYSNSDEYVSEFVDFLDIYTGSSATNKKYNVSSIVLADLNNCSYNLDPQATVSERYLAIANATNGVIGNICSPDFSTQLTQISQQIVTLSTRFELSREPIVESIIVTINGQSVPQDNQNGWSYLAENSSHFVEFHGSAVPPQGASISIKFDPKYYGD